MLKLHELDLRVVKRAVSVSSKESLSSVSGNKFLSILSKKLSS